MIITIDGRAASGKSVSARLLARRIGASFLDTGAMYRAVTLAAMRAKVDIENEEAVLKVLSEKEFDFTSRGRDGQMVVKLDGVDVSGAIREPAVTANAQYVASSAKVRKKLVEMQRRYALGQRCLVTEGRDQGTIAFPEANIKFYLTASPDERARRRQQELSADGKKVSLQDVRRAIRSRDESDEGRSSGPLKAAEGAIVVDTTDMSIEEVVAKLFGFLDISHRGHPRLCGDRLRTQRKKQRKK